MSDDPAQQPIDVPVHRRTPESAAATVEAFLSTSRSARTRRSRLADLASLGRWAARRRGQPQPLIPEAAAAIGAEVLLSPASQSASEAFLAEEFGHRSPATRNRARSTFRSFAKGLRRWGLTGLVLELPGEPSRPYRDTRGPGHEVVVRLWARTAAGQSPRDRRDAAILALAYGLGLRADEILTLGIEHLDSSRQILAVREKKPGGTRREEGASFRQGTRRKSICRRGAFAWSRIPDRSSAPSLFAGGRARPRPPGDIGGSGP